MVKKISLLDAIHLLSNARLGLSVKFVEPYAGLDDGEAALNSEIPLEDLPEGFEPEEFIDWSVTIDETAPIAQPLTDDKIVSTLYKYFKNI